MWIRSAFWVGRPQAGQEADFDDAIATQLVPTLNRLPGVSSARALWPRRREDNPPDIYCQIIVEFADDAAMQTMLASGGRKALRVRVGEIAAMFDGAISHIDYEVGPLA